MERKRKIIIGLSGKLSSGKDTVADMICADYDDREWKVCRFAERLKLVVAVLTNTPVEMQYTEQGKQTVPPGLTHTLGELQQIVGTVLRTAVHPDLWCDIAVQEARATLCDVVFVDVRYPNEAHAIRALGGRVVRIDGDPVGRRGRDTRDPSHPSEVALDDFAFDATIINNGTLDELKLKVHSVMDRFIKDDV